MAFSIVWNNIHLVFVSSLRVRRLFSGITQAWSTVRWASCHSTTLTKVRHWKSVRFMLLKIQFYVFEIIFLEGSGDLKKYLHNYQPHVSQKHHSTQLEIKEKSSHRLHFSHQSNRPQFPDWALGPTQHPTSTARLVDVAGCGWLKQVTHVWCESQFHCHLSWVYWVQV